MALPIQEVLGAPECMSFVFDKDGKVSSFTGGYIMDRSVPLYAARPLCSLVNACWLLSGIMAASACFLCHQRPLAMRIRVTYLVSLAHMASIICRKDLPATCLLHCICQYRNEQASIGLDATAGAWATRGNWAGCLGCFMLLEPRSHSQGPSRSCWDSSL